VTSERHVALSIPELVESFLGVCFIRAIRNNDAGNGKIVPYMFIIFAALKLHVHWTWYRTSITKNGPVNLRCHLSCRPTYRPCNVEDELEGHNSAYFTQVPLEDVAKENYKPAATDDAAYLHSHHTSYVAPIQVSRKECQPELALLDPSSGN